MSIRPPETPSSGLGAMLTQDRFRVPNHQRDYSWTPGEINQLFDDVQDAIARGADQYFLGLMVCISAEDNTLTLLDGQQRLATAIIFFSAVRAWLKQVEEHSEDAQQIRDDYIGRRELGEKAVTPKINLNSTNNPLFQQYVVSDAPLSEIENRLKALKKHDRNFHLLNSIMVCSDRVRAIAESSADAKAAAKSLIEIVKYMHENVRVVRFIVQDDASAYTIFETLNDRGLDLTTIDLVKNHLFGRISSNDTPHIKELEDRWAQMMFTLANVKANDFLKVFWTSRHGRTQKDNLFQNLKKNHRTTKSALDLSTELVQAADHYAALESPDDVVWKNYSAVAKETIGALKVIGSAQTHPIILAALNRFKPPEFERLLRLLETVLVRYQLVGGERTGRLEIQCAKTAKEIFDGDVRTAAQAKDSLKDIYVSDADFRQAFQAKEERSSTKAHYLLRKLEIEERRIASSDGARVIDPGIGLTIEHILPKNPGAEWNDIVSDDPEIVDDCVYRLGNLCLLGKLNKEVGRKPFSKKNAEYGKTEILTTQSLTQYTKWARQQIDQRQAIMAKRAVTVWRF
ncbi:DUF262 domain-containing protein [Bradyrhizobium sp. AUGA SZCCT0042]|uniref:DUF262 domain-containing protein n=1 Tax=Bradyrhizobium sp. AUGA SZCCT0042 TaxID=2807651 RepID=UPI001BA75C1D|nr:DUF262 domain-containing protein [Bradyrhizobium sp. AUGA SZCCT0042]MBR1300061.1 DUF262 domain-containing protein [Bradyrhizobium sp. AUGA SZCCT0042]